MGYQLVAAALQPHWGALLTSTERLVLLVMCQQALDNETDGTVPPRQYWGGTDLIVLQLRGDLPAKGTAEHRTAAESVRRALRKLEQVGAIKRARVATNGLRAEYEITVFAPTLPVDKPAQATAASPT